MDESAAPRSQPTRRRVPPVPKISKKTAVVGAAIGIGSAAIVAALLYANRNSKS